jgi:hypothetical protein
MALDFSGGNSQVPSWAAARCHRVRVSDPLFPPTPLPHVCAFSQNLEQLILQRIKEKLFWLLSSFHYHFSLSQNSGRNWRKIHIFTRKFSPFCRESPHIHLPLYLNLRSVEMLPTLYCFYAFKSCEHLQSLSANRIGKRFANKFRLCLQTFRKQIFGFLLFPVENGK